MRILVIYMFVCYTVRVLSTVHGLHTNLTHKEGKVDWDLTNNPDQSCVFSFSTIDIIG